MADSRARMRFLHLRYSDEEIELVSPLGTGSVVGWEMIGVAWASSWTLMAACTMALLSSTLIALPVSKSVCV